MTWYEILLAITLILTSIVIVVFVLMQKSNEGGVSSVIMGGSNETFFGKNKARSKEAKLQKVTKIFAVIFFVLCLITTLILSFFRAGL